MQACADRGFRGVAATSVSPLDRARQRAGAGSFYAPRGGEFTLLQLKHFRSCCTATGLLQMFRNHPDRWSLNPDASSSGFGGSVVLVLHPLIAQLFAAGKFTLETIEITAADQFRHRVKAFGKRTQGSNDRRSVVFNDFPPHLR